MPDLPDLDLARIRAYCEGRVPPRSRDQIRIEATVRGKSVTIDECHPPWHPADTEWSRSHVAQLRYDRETARWTLYCADRNRRWHIYDRIPPGTVTELLAELQRDPTSIFWG